jgi:hypothetical protein
MSTPFLLDLGFSRSDVGLVNKVFGLGSTIVGSLVGGALVAKMGLNRSLWVFAILQAISNFTFVVLAMAGKVYYLLILAVGVENFTGISHESLREGTFGNSICLLFEPYGSHKSNCKRSNRSTGCKSWLDNVLRFYHFGGNSRFGAFINLCTLE